MVEHRHSGIKTPWNIEQIPFTLVLGQPASPTKGVYLYIGINLLLEGLAMGRLVSLKKLAFSEDVCLSVRLLKIKLALLILF